MILERVLRVPHPPRVLVGQFFDFEHVPFVHPRTLGRVEVLALERRRVHGEIRWPPFAGLRLRSRFRQEFLAPNRIEVEITGGLGRGTRYGVVLRAREGGTEVTERLHVRGLLAWGARLLRGRILRAMEEVWREDLAVGMCRGGWPGLSALGIAEAEIA